MKIRRFHGRENNKSNAHRFATRPSPVFFLEVVLMLALASTASCTSMKAGLFNLSASNSSAEDRRIVNTLVDDPQMTVADLGAGGGHFTILFARHAKKVYAIDIDRGLLNHVREKANDEGLENITTIHTSPDRSSLPDNSVNLVFTRNVFHHISDRIAYFRKLKDSLQPGGTVAILDYDSAWSAPPFTWSGHYTPSSQIKSEMNEAGYLLLKEYDFPSSQFFGLFAPQRD